MIGAAQIHRVNSAFVVISSSDNAFRAVTLEPGDTIGVHAERTAVRSGLVEVVYDGMAMAAYLRDIEDRTECIEPHSE